VCVCAQFVCAGVGTEQEVQLSPSRTHLQLVCRVCQAQLTQHVCLLSSQPAGRQAGRQAASHGQQQGVSKHYADHTKAVLAANS
jgi:hypothetical protein